MLTSDDKTNTISSSSADGNIAHCAPTEDEANDDAGSDIGESVSQVVSSATQRDVDQVMGDLHSMLTRMDPKDPSFPGIKRFFDPLRDS